jgi:putative transposase
MSNHIHLLVIDEGKSHVIPNSMGLAESRVAQEYNQRKRRAGAFWGDRYHATAIESGSHLLRCLRYIDLNSVRAGIVEHPSDWPFCGYFEIKENKQKNRLINLPSIVPRQ